MSQLKRTNLFKAVKAYKYLWDSFRRQKREVKTYIEEYVPANPRIFEPLKQFKDKYKGQRCFIIATGPSLTIEDVNKLKNEITFTMNSGYKLIANGFHPDYYFITDGTAYEKIKQDLENYDLPPVFYNEKDIKWENRHKAIPLPVKVSIVLTRWQWHKLPYFLNRKIMSDDISRFVTMGDTVVTIILQTCIYMGFKEIYLLGTDCSFHGKQKHSSLMKYDNEEKIYEEAFKSETQPTPGELFLRYMQDYREIKMFADKKGVKIYNATRGGMLEIFPRVDLDEILAR